MCGRSSLSGLPMGWGGLGTSRLLRLLTGSGFAVKGKGTASYAFCQTNRPPLYFAFRPDGLMYQMFRSQFLAFSIFQSEYILPC